LRKSLAWS